MRGKKKKTISLWFQWKHLGFCIQFKTVLLCLCECVFVCACLQFEHKATFMHLHIQSIPPINLHKYHSKYEHLHSWIPQIHTYKRLIHTDPKWKQAHRVITIIQKQARTVLLAWYACCCIECEYVFNKLVEQKEKTKSKMADMNAMEIFFSSLVHLYIRIRLIVRSIASMSNRMLCISPLLICIQRKIGNFSFFHRFWMIFFSLSLLHKQMKCKRKTASLFSVSHQIEMWKVLSESSMIRHHTFERNKI